MHDPLLRVVPLAPAVGARIEGVDLSRTPGAGLVAEIRRVWLEHAVVFFRRQSLDPEAFIQLARLFGQIGHYPFVAGMQGHPEITQVIKHPHEIHNFGGLWHTDTSYLERPPMGSLLYALDIPPLGGDTLFSSSYAAYQALSPGLQAFLQGLKAVSSADKPDAAITRVDRRRDRPGDAAGVVTTAAHPVVRTHPETGRKSLYLSPGHVTHLQGFDPGESRALLDYLFAHMVRPEFTCRWRWQPGDLALWDNRCTLHNALNDYHGHRRVMHRITLEGDTPV